MNGASGLAAALVYVVLTVAPAAPLFALQPHEMLADPAEEARARAIGKELRCLVCQNESIDESNAELAQDLRRLVRERIARGDSDAQVIDYVVSRYGDFVLMKPPLKAETYLLWFGPPLTLLVGSTWVALFFRRRSRGAAAGTVAPPGRLDAEEEKRVSRLLEDPQR